MTVNIKPGETIALALDAETGAAIISADGGTTLLDIDDAITTIARIERTVGPRWGGGRNRPLDC